jgi:NitT/TauT family transport system ATP-binding protein
VHNHCGVIADRPQTDVGIVFQEPVLLDWRNVLANVMLQVDIRRLRIGNLTAAFS